MPLVIFTFNVTIIPFIFTPKDLIEFHIFCPFVLFYRSGYRHAIIAPSKAIEESNQFSLGLGEKVTKSCLGTRQTAMAEIPWVV